MPAGYSVRCTPVPSLPVGEQARMIVSVDGPGPLMINKPYVPDDVIRVRFGVNPQVLRVVGVEMIQAFDHVAPLDHTVFGWTWAGQSDERGPESTFKTYVAYCWFWEGPGDPYLIEKPFNVEMGPLMAITVQGVAIGHTAVDLLQAWFGEFDTGTTIDDGSITIVPAPLAAKAPANTNNVRKAA